MFWTDVKPNYDPESFSTAIKPNYDGEDTEDTLFQLFLLCLLMEAKKKKD